MQAAVLNQRSLAGKLRNRFFGAGIVDEGLARGGGGDQCGDGGVVQGTRQARVLASAWGDPSFSTGRRTVGLHLNT